MATYKTGFLLSVCTVRVYRPSSPVYTQLVTSLTGLRGRGPGDSSG